MYDELIRSCRACATGYEGNCDNCIFSGEDCYKQLHKASAEAIEAQDRHILTLQHEIMAEAESHIAEMNRLNKQIEELSKMEKTTQEQPSHSPSLGYYYAFLFDETTGKTYMPKDE